jgi:hypothetical protein
VQYPYKTQDVPQLSSKSKDFRKTKRYRIYNMSPYAEYATDSIPGVARPWKSPLKDPVGEVVDVGKRPDEPYLRGELVDSDTPTARITATLGWYEEFIRREIDPIVQKAIITALDEYRP